MEKGEMCLELSLKRAGLCTELGHTPTELPCYIWAPEEDSRLSEEFCWHGDNTELCRMLGGVSLQSDSKYLNQTHG